MVFGLPFMGVGVVGALIAKGVITPSRGNDVPGWRGWAVAVILFAPGGFGALFLVPVYARPRF